ncbi:DUF6083 domain-containing protein [Streptomyces sp. NPDC057011]|uniref:DUF6083 domain-containing protein n=1 Tax=unclassified Streptomyces TaxID=2593676 RepID=UPI0036361104
MSASSERGGRPEFGPCDGCGLVVEFREVIDQQHDVALQPGEFPSQRLPERARWHLASGIAWPGENETAWCRLDHDLICPAAEEPEERILRNLQSRLAVRARLARDRRSDGR